MRRLLFGYLQDSLLLAHSCCVLSQFFSLLGFGEGGLVNLISAFNYLRILRQNSGATVQSAGTRDATETAGSACAYLSPPWSPRPCLWAGHTVLAANPSVPASHAPHTWLLATPLTEFPLPELTSAPVVKKNEYKARTQQNPQTRAF